jgi:hypothetical protein
MTRAEIVERVARSGEVKRGELADPRDREIKHSEIVAYIFAAAQRDGAFPRHPPKEAAGDATYLVREESEWLIVWFVAHRGGALPSSRYERRFKNFPAALAEFVRVYLPRDDYRTRRGVVSIVPDRG